MRSRIIATIVLVVLCHAIVFPQSGTFVMPPYLQAVTTNSIYVLVESTTADTVTVDFGQTEAYGSIARTASIDSTTEGTFVHNVHLVDLAPNSLYHYRARVGENRSLDASFLTAPLQGTEFRFAWMADCRSGVEVHDTISKRIADANPGVSLYGGDLCLRSTYSSFKEQFFRPNEQALIARIPFFNAPGNHEGWKTNTMAFTQAPQSASGTQDYYSFDYGDMHVLVVNNELDHGEGSPQYQFAQSDLSSTQRAWKIVMHHKPAYCAGGHDEDERMKTMSQQVFEPNHVDLVLAGHSHFFQHNLVNGIHFMVIGAAGAPLYNPGTAPYVVKSAREYCYAIGDVTPDRFALMVYNEKGAPLDTLVLHKARVQSPGKH
jgi:predicted phosphodiesterase